MSRDRWDNKPSDKDLLGYDPNLCRGSERRWAEAELAVARGELELEPEPQETITMVEGKLYVRTIVVSDDGSTEQELMAVCGRPFRLLRIYLSSEDGEQVSRGGWDHSSPQRVAALDGEIREATDEDITKFFDAWSGNGCPLYRMDITEKGFDKDLSLRVIELWSLRLDKYVDAGMEIPYGYKHAGYNYFRNQPRLWKMLAVAVLSESKDARGHQVLPTWTGVSLAATKTTLTDWATGGRNVQLNVQTRNWDFEVGDDYYRRSQVDDIIRMAPPPVAAAMRDLRAAQALSLSVVGDEALAQVAIAQKDLLVGILATQLLNVVQAVAAGESR